uniref:(northern house mosquito) hypothetical protein n=2 Tax=Culex pipiens TaxID=7175 RepID=A0A8D8APU4_CULPI
MLTVQVRRNGSTMRRNRSPALPVSSQQARPDRKNGTPRNPSRLGQASTAKHPLPICTQTCGRSHIADSSALPVERKIIAFEDRSTHVRRKLNRLSRNQLRCRIDSGMRSILMSLVSRIVRNESPLKINATIMRKVVGSRNLSDIMKTIVKNISCIRSRPGPANITMDTIMKKLVIVKI